MLQFYYAPLSPFSRPVWLLLLEKGLEFESISMKLNGDQFKPQFTALNPFAHIPVIVDGGRPVFECLAILDYLEAKYPAPSLLPTEPEALATVRMANLTCANELIPAIGGSVLHEPDSDEGKLARLRALQVLHYFEGLLADRPYLAGDAFSLAEIMAGSLVASLVDMGHSLQGYPQLERWLTGLRSRPSWQAIHLSPEVYRIFRSRLTAMAKSRTQRRLQYLSGLFAAGQEVRDD